MEYKQPGEIVIHKERRFLVVEAKKDLFQCFSCSLFKSDDCFQYKMFCAPGQRNDKKRIYYQNVLL